MRPFHWHKGNGVRWSCENPYCVDPDEHGVELDKKADSLFSDWIILIALIMFSTYGVHRLCEDVGILADYDGRKAFWFEESLHRWIWER
jgi:hypothetical protein